MIINYNNIEYTNCRQIIDILEDCDSKIAIWSNFQRFSDYEKKASLLVTPFVKELIKQSECYRLVLKQYYDEDDYYKESIMISNNSLYVKSEKYGYDYEDVNLESNEPYRIDLKDLIEVMKNNEEIQNFINLKNLSGDKLLEIERFVYELYIEDYQKYMNNEIEVFRINPSLIEQKIKDKTMGEHEKYPTLSILSTYYFLIKSLDFNEAFLTKSNEFTELIYEKVTNLVLSQGFITKYQDSVYNFPMQYESKRKAIEELNKLTINKTIKINTIIKSVLNNIKPNIVDKTKSDIYFSYITNSSNKAIIKDSDKNTDYEYYVDKFHPYKIGEAPYRRYKKEKDIRIIEDTEYNFSTENYILYEAKIVPRCYAPSRTYIVQVSYSFVEQGRFFYLKDGLEDNITEEELKNLPITIHEIDIFNPKILDIKQP